MGVESFTRQIQELTADLTGKPFDDTLAHDLNTRYAPSSKIFQDLVAACRDGIAEGWLCAREAGGIRYGRVIKPSPATHGFSVDVVDMNDVVGPHHVHPNGEIDLVMPIDDAAKFDGAGAGWVVYAPGSAHKPTVTAGRAIVLYLLPRGAIDFTASD